MYDFTQLLDFDWLDEIACADKDPEIFFVDAGRVLDEDVLNLCRACPVRRDCVRHAYRMHYLSGYFGGLSPGQRRALSEQEALDFIETDTPRKPSEPCATRPDHEGATLPEPVRLTASVSAGDFAIDAVAFVGDQRATVRAKIARGRARS